MNGEVVQKLEYHREVVRDCHWHPEQPILVSTSFDGSLVKWDTRHTEAEGAPEGKSGSAKRSKLPDPARDQLEY